MLFALPIFALLSSRPRLLSWVSLGLAAVVFGVVTLTFLLLHLAPGDPVQRLLGPLAGPEQVEAARAELMNYAGAPSASAEERTPEDEEESREAVRRAVEEARAD